MGLVSEIFITCAVTGGGERGNNPHLPITPAEICAAAIGAAKEGAAIVHCHVRDPATGKGSNDPLLYGELVDRIRSSGVDVIINLTGGMGGTFVVGSDGNADMPQPGSFLLGPEERIAHLAQHLPEICTIDCGSMNSARDDAVYIAPTGYLRQMTARVSALGIKPEFEIFDSAQLVIAKSLIENGLGGHPPLIQFCMGVPGGAPQNLGILSAMLALKPQDAVWTAFGLGRHQMPMVAQSILLGGNVRVGLEDNLYLHRGRFATNQELVAKARQIVELLGYSVMGPQAVRQKLELTPPSN